MKILRITAKCSDLFSATLEDNGEFVGEYDGYVPEWMPGEHGGDYVELTINIETGQILEWTPPTKAQSKETFGQSKP
jgi:hypothetical protein